MFECSMPKTERLSECIEWIDLSFVERQRTPSWAIQVGIRCHLAGMSLRDASNFLDELGVDRSGCGIDVGYHSRTPNLTALTAIQLCVAGRCRM
jgi:hypothetical protein